MTPPLPKIAVVPCETPTDAQLIALSGWLGATPAGAIHHLCATADEAVLRMIFTFAHGVPRIVAHPSTDGRQVCRRCLEASDGQAPPLGYHDRLLSLARHCDVMIGLISSALAGSSVSGATGRVSEADAAGMARGVSAAETPPRLPAPDRARDALDTAAREGTRLRVTITPEGSVIEEGRENA